MPDDASPTEVPLTCAAKHTCAGQAYIKAEQAAKRQEKARMATVRATSDRCHCDSCGAGGALSSFQGRLLCNQCLVVAVKVAADNKRKSQAQSEAAPVGGGVMRSMRKPQTDYRPITEKAAKVTLAVRALRFLLSLIVRKGSSDA